jgi:dTDP-4-dehydrorhamnose 3,5-epimerase
MKVTESKKIKGLLFLEMEKFEDDRGFFARNFCAKTLEDNYGNSRIEQANISFNRFRGTIRGFHYQINNHEEAKTVTVYSGSLHYKVVDLRKNSESYLEHESFEIDSLSKVVQVPRGCAPAFQTLEDKTLLHYYVSNSYSKDNEAGIRYNDPFFKFEWPLAVSVVSDRDQSFPDFDSKNFSGLRD